MPDAIATQLALQLELRNLKSSQAITLQLISSDVPSVSGSGMAIFTHKMSISGTQVLLPTSVFRLLMGY
jgi:hypothetical protein